MLTNPEFISLPEEDGQRISQTLTLLRKMRGAADKIFYIEGQRGRARIQNILVDAEVLGQTASSSLIDLLSPQVKRSTEKWSGCLDSYQE